MNGSHAPRIDPTPTMPKFDIDYYLTKFAAIPDDQWCIGEFTASTGEEAHCAFGHCGCTANNDSTEEGDTLDRLFRDHGLLVTAVNDADGTKWAGPFRDLPTPKARMLAALESFK